MVGASALLQCPALTQSPLPIRMTFPILIAPFLAETPTPVAEGEEIGSKVQEGGMLLFTQSIFSFLRIMLRIQRNSIFEAP